MSLIFEPIALRSVTIKNRIVMAPIHDSLREDGVPLSLRGVIQRHQKGHIPAITKHAEIVPLVQAINMYQSPIARAALKLAMLTGLRPGVASGRRCWLERPSAVPVC
jgi:2,4-dienoyl-CoA reductase-like NADH-dependent reductase (Old Yellow Enzyme family)